ncbi:hypothetical protein UlMin_023424 [Ulmus minor]
MNNTSSFSYVESFKAGSVSPNFTYAFIYLRNFPFLIWVFVVSKISIQKFILLGWFWCSYILVFFVCPFYVFILFNLECNFTGCILELNTRFRLLEFLELSISLIALRGHNYICAIIVHKESEQAEAWSQIFSEETTKQSILVIVAWELSERMYGNLQGFNKEKTAERYGKEITHGWRKSYDIPPPNGESLEICTERTVIEPDLQSGKHVMVFTHANLLRSIITSLDNLTSQKIINLEVSNGVPLLYIYKDGKLFRKGSPIGLTEGGVYAHTNERKYKQEYFEEFLYLPN